MRTIEATEKARRYRYEEWKKACRTTDYRVARYGEDDERTLAAYWEEFLCGLYITDADIKEFGYYE